jgi:putative transposase
MEDDHRGRGPRKWAELRFSVIGPLLASPPEKGELCRAIEGLTRKLWLHPTSGELVSFSASSIERWFYAARGSVDPIAVLMRKVRSDAGVSKAMCEALLEALGLQYAAHPGWSYLLHSDNLVALVVERPEVGKAPSYSTGRRRMR